VNSPTDGLIIVGSVVPRDATAVKKLRKAGAIIIGKANLSEWSRFRGSNITDGWSARGGQTQAAYVVGGYILDFLT
jgi:amidase